MATETSSIDDMLMGGKTDLQPATPESQLDDYEESTPENVTEEVARDSFEHDYIDPNEEAEKIEKKADEQDDFDDYGNEKPKERLYTLAELNEEKNKAVRERLARMKQGEINPQQAQQLQQQAQTFNADPNSGEDWQHQLESFVEQTFNKISQRDVTHQQQMREQQANEEFQDKFHQGMDRFGDFREVVGAQPFDNTMTYALRGMSDPAAFAYAAAKRHPQELQRISALQDPYAKMVEMGKLEERMKKTAQQTKAPRPVSRTSEDSTIKEVPKDKAPSIEDQIARSDARRLAALKQKRNR